MTKSFKGYCPETNSENIIKINYTNDQYHIFSGWKCDLAPKCSILSKTGHCPILDNVNEE